VSQPPPQRPRSRTVRPTGGEVVHSPSAPSVDPVERDAGEDGRCRDGSRSGHGREQSGPQEAKSSGHRQLPQSIPLNERPATIAGAPTTAAVVTATSSPAHKKRIRPVMSGSFPGGRLPPPLLRCNDEPRMDRGQRGLGRVLAAGDSGHGSGSSSGRAWALSRISSIITDAIVLLTNATLPWCVAFVNYGSCRADRHRPTGRPRRDGRPDRD
jgi:hypothetical protein